MSHKGCRHFFYELLKAAASGAGSGRLSQRQRTRLQRGRRASCANRCGRPASSIYITLAMDAQT